MDTAEFLPLGFKKELLTSWLAMHRVDAVLLLSPENVFYTTGYPGLPGAGNPILYTLRRRLPYFSIVTAEGEVILGCWGFSALGVRFGVDRVVGFESASEAEAAMIAVLGDAVGRNALVAIEGTCPFQTVQALRRASFSELEAGLADECLERLRLVKSPAEREVLRKATTISEQTLAEVMDLVHVGITRPELVREAKTRLMRNGASGVSHITMSFGANPEVLVDEQVVPGSLVTLDVGGIVDGYCSDVRRYMFAGEPPDELLKAHARIVDIIDEIGEALLPGARYSELFALAARRVQESGLNVPFNHIGHNLGIETEEEWITDNPSRQIDQGMVIALEIYAKTDGGFRVGNEETYIVSERGPERISRLPREIRKV